MRAFIVLCLVAVACADKLGYNYHPVGHSDSGLSFTPGSSSGSGFGGSSSGFGVSGSTGGSSGGFSVGGSSGGFGGSSHGSSGSFGVGGSSGFGSGGSSGFGSSGSSGFGVGGSSGGFGHGGSGSGFSVGGSSGGFSAGGSSGGASYGGEPHVELEKEFYTFTANDDEFTEPHVENQVVSTAKKGLRVIFIKGPENRALENAAVSLAKHAAEQRTAIYVLTKQADVNALKNKLNVITTDINNKPEVHFVKYRTQEDAINAQKAIQSQYDSLGGTTQNFDGGVAPVLNFASKAPVAAHGSHGSFGSSGSLGSGSSVSFVSSGSHGSSGSFGSSGSLGSSGSFGSSGSSGSFGSSGSSGSLVSSGSSDSVSFSSDDSVGTSGSSVSGSLSSTYLPATTK